MKVSLNWMQQYSNVDIKGIGRDEILRRIGAQLGAVEETIDIAIRYDKVVVARVVSCVDHPNADRLHVCMVDDGGVTPGVTRDENGHVQVVCGAPNAREGLLVAWLPPGSTVPASHDEAEPFVLSARELRGVVSNGMLASPKELGISDEHEGILEITDDVQPGTPFVQLYGLDDFIIDCENKMFTHRPDCFGQLGVARELAGITGQKFESPDWYLNPQLPANNHADAVRGLSVDVQIPDLVPRYMAAIVDNVKIGPSPIWLQSFLKRVGLKPINNIVDMTNYMMMLTGQPLHAFDFDKVARNGVATIVVRHPRDGEKVGLLDGKVIEPRKDAILICDQDKPIALGGVMGGNNSEIDENTTRIIIEAANFDMYNIRRTSMANGIFTDAVTRFNKGQSPAQCAAVLYKAIAMTQELSEGAVPVGEPVDSNHAAGPNLPVKVTADFINTRLGSDLNSEEIRQILENVELATEVQDNELTITPPFWRMDIELPEDIVEEVGRLYDFGKLPVMLPKRTTKAAPRDKMLDLKQKIRSALKAGGANEIQSYSFVHGNLLKKVGQDPEAAYHIRNALSPDLQYYRLSLTPSLLDKVHPNIKAGYDEFAIFEMGRTHVKMHGHTEENVPKEINTFALVYAANDKAAKQRQGAAYFNARHYLEFVCRELGIANLKFEAIASQPDFPITAAFDYKRSALVYDAKDGVMLGIVGEYRQEVIQALKLPQSSAGFELSLDSLLEAQKPTQYAVQSRFPAIEQDITLRLPVSVSHQDLVSFFWDKYRTIEPQDTQSSLRPLDIFKHTVEDDHKNVTLRFKIAANNRTLKAEEVNSLLDKIAESANAKFGAERL